jgi:hypothetical protein
MTRPQWRNQHGGGFFDPLREMMRQDCIRPVALDGLVIEDVDIVMRRYASVRPATDRFGCVRLVEHKHGRGELDTAQRMTFGVLNALLERADPDRRRYHGFYLVRTDGHPFDCLGGEAVFKVNGQAMDQATFVRWCNFDPDVWVRPHRFRLRLPEFD